MSRSTKILFLTNVLCVSSECILCFNCDLPWYASSKSVMTHQQFWIQHGKPPSVVLARKSVTEIRIWILVSAQPNAKPIFWTAPRSVHQSAAMARCPLLHTQRWIWVLFAFNFFRVHFLFCPKLCDSIILFCLNFFAVDKAGLKCQFDHGLTIRFTSHGFDFAKLLSWFWFTNSEFWIMSFGYPFQLYSNVFQTNFVSHYSRFDLTLLNCFT